MLSYQHAYHAGNYADVLKHLTLCEILYYLIQKDKPLYYLETHAGRGLYPLNGPEALKTPEWKEGIGLLWQAKDAPKAIKAYLERVASFNENKKLLTYPGSPALALHLLREIDRAYFCEKHPKEFEHLTHNISKKQRIHLGLEDGLEKLLSTLPPKERRGLILIDPSYEQKMEYLDISRRLLEAYQRFDTGVYCLWFPIVDSHQHQKLISNLKKINADKTLYIEFYPGDKNTLRMQGTGMFIINPPYTLYNSLNESLKFLQKHVYGTSMRYKISPL